MADRDAAMAVPSRDPADAAACDAARPALNAADQIDADRVLAELEELAFSTISHYEIDPIRWNSQG
jgi:hypothetical protein